MSYRDYIGAMFSHCLLRTRKYSRGLGQVESVSYLISKFHGIAISHFRFLFLSHSILHCKGNDPKP